MKLRDSLAENKSIRLQAEAVPRANQNATH